MGAQYQNGFQFHDIKQQNRFIFKVDGIASWHARAVNLPQIEQNPVTVDTINSDYKQKGKSRWQDISLTLYDPIQSPASKEVHAWLLKHHISSTDTDFLMAGYKKEVTLQYILPMGSPFETWKLHGAFVASSNWGDLDVSSDDLVTIDVTLSYDWAELS